MLDRETAPPTSLPSSHPGHLWLLQ